MITIPGLSSSIKGAIIAEFGTPTNATELQNFCDALATGIVPYLIANTEVLPGTFTTPTGGPVTGEGTIT